MKIIKPIMKKMNSEERLLGFASPLYFSHRLNQLQLLRLQQKNCTFIKNLLWRDKKKIKLKQQKPNKT